MRLSRLQHRRKTTLRVDAALVLAAASVVLGACTGGVEDRGEQAHMGRAIQPIVNGTTSGAEQDSVVALARFDGGVRVGLCTATLVAPNLVLTARHCVSATDASAACGSDGTAVVGAMLHGDRPAGSLAVYATTGGAAPDTTLEAGASAHGKALVVDDATTICNHDLAFVILDTSLTAPKSPLRLGPSGAAGDVLTAVGFGITEVGALPSQRMQRADVALLGAGPMAFPDDARYGAGDAELLVGESACAGDSGSPMFARAAGASTPAAIVGVASRAGNGQARDPNNAASTCLGANAHAVYAELGKNEALVLRAFAEAGKTPWLEGQPDPDAVKPAAAAAASPSVAGGDRGATAASPSAGPAQAESGAMAPTGVRDDAPEPGGCSVSSDARHNPLEETLAIVFALSLVGRLRDLLGRRRRRRRKTT